MENNEAKKLVLGIDAFNISSGGGLTHLIAILKNADPRKYGFEKVVLCGNQKMLDKIPDMNWLHKFTDSKLNKSLVHRLIWHRFKSKKYFLSAGCDIIFVPGGTCLSGFFPNVTMCRNMLPFEWREFLRYGFSRKTFKFMVLRFAQLWTFRRASGLIFLSNYAKASLLKLVKKEIHQVNIIPHGVPEIPFSKISRQQKKKFTKKSYCRLLYVSDIAPYKHHCNVVEAVIRLNEKGLPVHLQLIGSAAEGMPRLLKTLNHRDPEGKFITYSGEMSHEKILKVMKKSDIGIFASSCENLPNILIEMMSVGLPIACSNKGPMPEILGDAGEYFDPLDFKSISSALEDLISSFELREKYAKLAFEAGKDRSWKQCADETFEFLSNIVDV